MAILTHTFFTKTLLQWNRELNTRQMPWKNEADPYRIWLSEIMLQQTRVEQGWPYYLRFIERFPTVEHLAAANDDEVFKLWEGLGYYSRCRNLLHTARYISSERKGRFPETYAEIRQLKGVGNYTAAAIASFAYHLPHAVVDGNVVRLLARFFGLDHNPQTAAGKNAFETLANTLIPNDSPAEFNQAIMDFGATVCMPRLPLCTRCPLQSECVALKHNRVMQLPVKKASQPKRQRYFLYAMVLHENRILIRQRQNKDVWQGLYEFVLKEVDQKADFETACPVKLDVLEARHRFLYTQILKPQQLSHQTIYIRLCWYSVSAGSQVEGYSWKPITELKKLAFPKSLQGVWNHLDHSAENFVAAAEPGETYG